MKKGLKKAIAFIASSVLVISALVGCSSNTTKIMEEKQLMN